MGEESLKVLDLLTQHWLPGWRFRVPPGRLFPTFRERLSLPPRGERRAERGAPRQSAAIIVAETSEWSVVLKAIVDARVHRNIRKRGRSLSSRSLARRALIVCRLAGSGLPDVLAVVIV